MKLNILIISNHPDSAWLQIVSEALQPLGEVSVEQEAPERVAAYNYDLIIIDAATIDGDAAVLTTHLHEEQPSVPIVVATTSPTWQRARQVFLAGAVDYIRKSFDRGKILTIVQDILERSRFGQPLQGE